MVNIYIQDSGLISVPYSVSETSFPNFSSATQTQKRAGEFKVQNSTLLKITGISFDASNSTQNTNGGKDNRVSVQKTGFKPIQFTLTCEVDKPKNYFIGTNTKDLPIIGNIIKMIMSRGYKQIWIVGEPGDNTDHEQLFSFYQLIETFGITDASLSVGTTVGSELKHLKVSLDGYIHNEGVENLSYQLAFTLLWDM